MRNTILVVLLLVLFWTGTAMAETPLWGVSFSGVYYIQDSLVSKHTSEPWFRGDVTNFKDQRMVRKGVYWIYDSGKPHNTGFSLVWCVVTNLARDEYIPHQLIRDLDSRITPDMVEGNGRAGYNIRSKPSAFSP